MSTNVTVSHDYFDRDHVLCRPSGAAKRFLAFVQVGDHSISA